MLSAKTFQFRTFWMQLSVECVCVCVYPFIRICMRSYMHVRAAMNLCVNLNQHSNFNFLISFSCNLRSAVKDGCFWEEVEGKTNSRMARVCFMLHF